MQPDLGLRYFETRNRSSVFTFTRFEPSMIARVDQDLFTAISNIEMEREYAVSIDFDGALFQRLLKMLSTKARSVLERAFGGAFVDTQTVDIPPGAVAIGVRAKLGELQTNADEQYVPFLAEEFLAATATTSITIDGEVLKGG